MENSDNDADEMILMMTLTMIRMMMFDDSFDDNEDFDYDES